MIYDILSRTQKEVEKLDIIRPGTTSSMPMTQGKGAFVFVRLGLGWKDLNLSLAPRCSGSVMRPLFFPLKMTAATPAL